MNGLIRIPAILLLALLPSSAQTPVGSSLSYKGTNGSNQLLLSWVAVPGKQYNVLTTTTLGSHPWQVLNPSPLAASYNLVKFSATNDQSARFYKVVKLDTDPPQVWRLSPASNAIAVGLQSPLKAWLSDETGIDPSSIVFSVANNPPVTMADPRLGYTNGVLTYTPGTNEFLGTNAQTVTAQLAVSDTLGHRGTNSWPFQLELATILASNIVLIGSPSGPATNSGGSSGLTLVSTNGDTYVFSYTGASSGLTNGQVLVSIDPGSPYKRRVLSLTDNPATQTVSLLTTQACLAECIQQGSIRLVGDFSQQSSLAGIPLDGAVIFDNGTIRLEVGAGQITFNPDFTVAGTWSGNRLTSFDSEISATLGLDLTLRGSFQASGDSDASKTLGTPIRRLSLVGFIGVVPVGVEADLEFNIGYTAHLETEGSVTAGFQSSRTLTFGANLRDGQWGDSAQETSSFNPLTAGWQINGSGTVQAYLEPKLTVYLESLAGPSAGLKPYLEVDGNACLPPGQAGADLSLYAGLSSTLAVDVRGWDCAWRAPSSWEPFDSRGLIWRRNVATSTGPSPQTLPNMVWIPCGTFTQGSPDTEAERNSDEGPQTSVTISHGFWMGKYAVSQGEYLSVIGDNPSYFTTQDLGGNPISSDLSRPVEQVTWNDAMAYCAALTMREQTAGRLPTGYVYRLPTEAEWEYACRAGTTTAFHYGPSLRSGMANFYGRYEYDASIGNTYNSSGIYLARTTAVGNYAPNALGLYDMHGNVWEWCQDWYGGAYPGGSVTDPTGPATGSARVLRGGAWPDSATLCRSALRYNDPPGVRYFYIGFRVVLAPGQP